MTAPAREPSPRLLVDTIEHLRKDNAALSRLVTEMKEREARLVRALSEMFQAPAQSVASAKYADGQWEVVMSTGAVWQRVERVIDTPTEHRYVECWVPRPSVPTSRPAIMERVQEALPVLSLVARDVA
jgi:hypothetical protein